MLEIYSEKLKRSPQGIWKPGIQTEDISYPQDGHESRFSLEEKSFWFKHRNRCIEEIVKKFPPEGVLFDIGGGNGYVSLGLQKAGIDTVLVEPGNIGAHNAKLRGVQHVVCSSFEEAEFQSESLPAAGLFDVVEHIENDSDFLISILKKLKPNGRLYITVPAYKFLWSAKDLHEGHYRRYSISEIETVLATNGFEVEYASYFFSYLVLPIFLLKTLPFKLGLTKSHDTKKGQQEHKPAQGMLKWIIDLISNSEFNKIKNLKSIKFGSSIVVVARKPENR